MSTGGFRKRTFERRPVNDRFGVSHGRLTKLKYLIKIYHSTHTHTHVTSTNIISSVAIQPLKIFSKIFNFIIVRPQRNPLNAFPRTSTVRTLFDTDVIKTSMQCLCGFGIKLSHGCIKRMLFLYVLPVYYKLLLEKPPEKHDTYWYIFTCWWNVKLKFLSGSLVAICRPSKAFILN